MQQNFDSVIEILKKEGLSDEKIGEFVLTLNNTLTQELYMILVEQLGEEDMQKLNLVTDETERQNQMRQIFEQKTGQNLKEISDGFVNKYVEEFLEGYRQTLAAPSTL